MKVCISFFLVLSFSIVGRSQCYDENKKVLDVITRFTAEISAEYKSPKELLLSEIMSRNYIKHDPYIYSYEEITIYVKGKMNINPCDKDVSSSGFLGFGQKSYTERTNNFLTPCQLKDQLIVNVGESKVDFSDCLSNCEYLIGKLDAIRGAFTQKLDLTGFVEQDEPKCSGRKQSSEGYFEVIVEVNSSKRFSAFRKKLKNESSFSVEDLKEWINPRMESQFRTDISNLIIREVDNKNISSKEKIKILEYISNFIHPGNIKVNLALGKAYKDAGEIENCISNLINTTRAFNSEENRYLLKSYYYSNELALAYEYLGFCLINNRQSTDEPELLNAAFSYNEASRFFIQAKQFQKAFKAKMNQINVLKRINSIPSLNAANNILVESINFFEELDKSEEIDMDIYNEPPLIINGFIEIENPNTLWEQDEIIIENNTIIEFRENPTTNYFFKIKSNKLILGENIKILKVSGTGNEHTEPASGYTANSGALGNPGENSKTTIEIEGRIIYLGSVNIDLAGGKGGKGQQGGRGTNGGSTLLSSDPDRGDIVIYDSGGTGGVGGTGGQGGNGGNVKITLIDDSNSITQDFFSKISVNVSPGCGGEEGNGGLGGFGGDEKIRGINDLPGMRGGKTGPIGKKGENGAPGKFELYINGEAVQVKKNSQNSVCEN